LGPSAPAFAEGRDDVEIARRSVVRIDVSYLEYHYDAPYRAPTINRAGGTGFIIRTDKGLRILTNAHVVSQSNTIRLHRADQREDYPAKVVYIAHDCDLAILDVADAKFFQNAAALEIGESPELNSPVLVIGFPIGGDRVSITRGIVSRKDMDTYAHSSVDSHATIQVDAAINPGNSGGPGIQNGKAIGVAFQSLSRGENLGYLIPPEVIRKFLTDIADGKYHGYVDFGTFDMSTRNSVLRKALGLGAYAPDTGLLVYEVMKGSSADGFIKPGDVLLALNGKRLSQDGEVDDGEHLVPYIQLIDNIAAGTMIEVDVLRDGKKLTLKFPARRSHLIDFLRINYDTPPPFYLEGGCFFQPLDANLMDQHTRAWARDGRVDLLYVYNQYISSRLYERAEEFVLFSGRLNDEFNVYNDRYLFRMVETVNGQRVRTFREFAARMEAASKTDRIEIRFVDYPVPLVMETKHLGEANNRITRTYGLKSRSFVPEAAR
jgi:S1-C subfamily serine protease